MILSIFGVVWAFCAYHPIILSFSEDLKDVFGATAIEMVLLCAIQA